MAKYVHIRLSPKEIEEVCYLHGHEEVVRDLTFEADYSELNAALRHTIDFIMSDQRNIDGRIMFALNPMTDEYCLTVY